MEFFDKYPVHEAIKQRITTSIDNDKLAHALLFYGPEGSGKEAFALELARYLNCDSTLNRPCYQCPSCGKITQLKHPDIKFLFPTSSKWKDEDIRTRLKKKADNPFARIDLPGHTVIQIERIRELKEEAKFASFEAKNKVFIISDAEKMSREGANSFLKLLEEPPEGLIIILITSSRHLLLDTIRSRCQQIYFPPLSPEDAARVVHLYHENVDNLRQITHIAQGNLKQIFDLMDLDLAAKRKHLIEYLRAAAAGKALDVLRVVDSLTMKRDKNFLKELLDLLILWFRDAVYLTAIGPETTITNLDYETELKKFSENYAKSDFNKIVQFIEEAQLNLQRNVFNPLLLTNLAFRINRELIRG
jgi:DNA polymerase-3 subunit delta'